MNFVFTFSIHTFASAYAYSLTHSLIEIKKNGAIIANLPSWLTFDDQNLTFEGIPPLDELDSFYEFTV